MNMRYNHLIIFLNTYGDNATAEMPTVEDFMNSIHSIALAKALEEFGFEVQLIVFLCIVGIPEKKYPKLLVFLDIRYQEDYPN